MNIQSLYETHHTENARFGFSVLEQERVQWFLAKMKQLWVGQRLLDIGCRDATLTKHFLPYFTEVTGVDIDSRALERATHTCPSARFLQMDVTGSWETLPANGFDVVLCSEVLEHLYFPEKIADQIRRVLAPGGVCIGSVPNAFFLKHRLRYLLGNRRYTPLEDPTHITQFNQSHLEMVLKRIGPSIKIGGYTRFPFNRLADAYPGWWAFDFLFWVQRSPEVL
ncbi:class I SAM-dependent methyltransferase [Candidatus Uhrbacteria bacterium]|nr:class I SAM-dependent methyltransferase [Candidatus Uhrbacteria bacterium]